VFDVVLYYKWFIEKYLLSLKMGYSVLLPIFKEIPFVPLETSYF